MVALVGSNRALPALGVAALVLNTTAGQTHLRSRQPEVFEPLTSAPKPGLRLLDANEIPSNETQSEAITLEELNSKVETLEAKFDATKKDTDRSLTFLGVGIVILAAASILEGITLAVRRR